MLAQPYPDGRPPLEAVAPETCEHCKGGTWKQYSGYVICSIGLGPRHPFEGHYRDCPAFLEWKEKHGAQYLAAWKAWEEEQIA